jgi:hypothetical protein
MGNHIGAGLQPNHGPTISNGIPIFWSQDRPAPKRKYQSRSCRKIPNDFRLELAKGRLTLRPEHFRDALTRPLFNLVVRVHARESDPLRKQSSER